MKQSIKDHYYPLISNTLAWEIERKECQCDGCTQGHGHDGEYHGYEITIIKITRGEVSGIVSWVYNDDVQTFSDDERAVKGGQS